MRFSFRRLYFPQTIPLGDPAFTQAYEAGSDDEFFCFSTPMGLEHGSALAYRRNFDPAFTTNLKLIYFRFAVVHFAALTSARTVVSCVPDASLIAFFSSLFVLAEAFSNARTKALTVTDFRSPRHNRYTP